MNQENYLTVAVAALCICAVGFSAANLDHALDTDPDDVVDLEYETLPIGKDDAGHLEQQVESNKESGQSGGGGSGESSGGGGGSDDDGGDAGGSDGSGQAASDQQRAGGGDGELPGLSENPDRLPFDLLPWLVLLAVLALAYRYRRRLLVLTMVLLGVTPRSSTEEDEVTAAWHGVEPSNEVHRAWLAMVDSIPVERPWTRTPSECASIARDTGADPEAVANITETFEEVRYGGRPVTDERRERAREGLERLRTRGESR